ncbi:MAG: hypothetical protein M1480_05975 [Bacteroidetes bacterium]|nr:hypothetical protein [Bacteroidota bacterium]
MQKQQITYSNSIEAIVALAKRLSVYEEHQGISSEEFFDKYRKGLFEDSIEFVEWSNDYQNFLALKLELENLLGHAA